MMEPEYTLGCILDQAATEATIVRMQASGQQPLFGDVPQLRGTWDRLKARGVKAVLLPQLMDKYFPGRPADFQNGSPGTRPAPDEGTCVGRGTYRACMLSYLHAIDSRQIVGRPVVIAYEPIYAGSRTVIGGGRLRGGGSVGAWAAEWVSRYGCVSRHKCGSLSLEDTPIGRTDLAAKWGRNGVPISVMQTGANHRFDAHFAENVDQQLDCLAAGFAGAFCRSRLNGKRDQYGMSRPAGQGNHCEAVVGVFVGHNGEDAILMRQSWKDAPGGPSTLKLHGGETYQLPQGCYGIFADDQRNVWSRWAESWHFQPKPESGFHV